MNADVQKTNRKAELLANTVEHVAIDDSWSALLLRPAPDNEPDTFTADIAWPPTQ